MSLAFDVNWLAVLIATVACTVLGGLYFGLAVSRPYAAAMGRVGQPAWRPPASALAGQTVATLLVVITSAVLLRTLDVREVGTALLFGLVVGVGYLAAMVLNIAINPNFPHPFRYALLNAPYFLACSLLTSTVIALLA
ncbi:DUF1761 domain-containing protein [Cryptosporangium arvum]|uniref:DUF1761 domain-containing protein n=1 Tax=Cryptosporangium arvum DSM 44712 TaxID=927661 RepID=A0A011AF05_9ACTN|nr:DUF1761 domain-containing protein [Cryptosporangium arvum]EXG80621.1 hypothetical protein CryarDRAFT_1705 [Cryptosporangium arvum DSM 44712]